MEEAVTRKLAAAASIFDRGEESLKDLLMEELIASVASSVEAIDEVSNRSKNLKGTMVGKLRAASTHIRVVLDELSYRAHSNAGRAVTVQEASMRLMREKMERAEEETRRLRREL